MPFGQLVVGPPGSGKSTYCRGVSILAESIGRSVAVVNLDPANENLTYDCAVNIQELVSVGRVMEEYELGPNGALLYCMDYILKNLDWLLEALKPFRRHYILFDCPGQAELYVHHHALREILQKLELADFRLCAVNLVDAYQCVHASSFVAAMILSLNVMLHLEMPHINVLSKVDLLRRLPELPCDARIFFEGTGLRHLVRALENEPLPSQYKELSRNLCELLEDFSLVNFLPMDVMNSKLVLHVIKSADHACGYLYETGDMLALVAPADELDLERILEDVLEAPMTTNPS